MARFYVGPALGMLFFAHAALGAGADPAAARAQLLKGYALKQKGQCDEAVPYFKESARLDRQPKALLNLADCEEKLRHLSAAQTHFLEARDVARAFGLRPYEKLAQERLAALERNIPKLVITLVRDAPADTSVTRDGVELSQVSLQTPLPIDPGKHTVVARTPLLEREYEVILSEGETKEIEVTPLGGRSIGSATAAQGPPASAAAKRTESSDATAANRGESGASTPAKKSEPTAAPAARSTPTAPDAKRETSVPPPKSPVFDVGANADPPPNGRAQRTAGIIMLGAGAVGIGLGIFSGAQFAAKNETLSNTCTTARTCTESAPYEQVRDEAMTARTLSIVGFASGAVLAGVGLVLVLNAPSSSTASADRFTGLARTAGRSLPPPTGLRSVKVEPVIGGGAAGFVAGGSW